MRDVTPGETVIAKATTREIEFFRIVADSSGEEVTRPWLKGR
jgi:hypothetical protein